MQEWIRDIKVFSSLSQTDGDRDVLIGGEKRFNPSEQPRGYRQWGAVEAVGGRGSSLESEFSTRDWFSENRLG